MADTDSTSSRAIISRKQAKALGLLRYFPGSTCKHGHVAERLVSNGSCLDCCSIKQKDWYRANREADLARQKRYREAHPEQKHRNRDRLHAANPEMKARSEQIKAERSARDAARAAGKTMYESTRTCSKCGASVRFCGDSKCVECNRVNCNIRTAKRLGKIPGYLERREAKKREIRDRREKQAKISARTQAVRSARQGALERGDKTYVGRPCPKGHDGVRYATCGGCVACGYEYVRTRDKKQYDKLRVARLGDKLKKQNKARYEANREARLAAAKAWAQKNRDKRKTISQNYKHRRRAQEASGVTFGELHAWKKAQRKVCYWCGKKCEKGFCVDHYQPLSKGGAHELSNLVIACRSCNARKSAKDPEQFRAETWHGTLFSRLVSP